MNILLFGGTTEGRKLARLCGQAGLECTVCVATEYGEAVLEDFKESVHILQGRMDEGQMEKLMAKNCFDAVVDATHPYAAEASANIKRAAKSQGVKYIRLLRERQRLSESDNVNIFASNEECARWLCEREGNILLTTGSKELSAYASCEALRERLYVRVLPSSESMRICSEQGISGRHIIAMQRPSARRKHAVIIAELQSAYIVTTERGRAGGFEEKVDAALSMGRQVCIIGAPVEEEGSSFTEVCALLEEVCGVSLMEYAPLEISLVGIGMGAAGNITLEAKQAVREADVVFGARRLLATVDTNAVKEEYYLARDIIPYLKSHAEYQRAAVVLSGDSGFYSGANKLAQQINEELKNKSMRGSLKIISGVPSVSYLAAKLQMPWQDAKIASLHGRDENVCQIVRRNKKTFLLLSGKEDLERICGELMENNLRGVKIHAGFSLSYPDEKIFSFSPECLPNDLPKGLYACFIINENADKETLTHGICDDLFVRGNVPMTKEEIRCVAVSRLNLAENAIVYDIGCGTGSVAIECARLSERIKVYGIEKNPEGARLIRENMKKFSVTNIEVIEGSAPEALQGLEPPTHVFIGGSGGSLKEILESIMEKTKSARVVITAVTLETVAEINDILKTMPVSDESITQIQASRGKRVGGYHMMQAENPVYIAAFRLRSL